MDIITSSNEIQLTPDQELKAAAKIIGYKKLPPTIEQFIEDDYYLGKVFGNNKLFPFWTEWLKEIFPTPIHTRYPYIAVTGGIGTGKSTFSKVCALYNRCRLDHMANHSFFGLARTKGIDFSFFHVSKQKAWDDFVDSIRITTEDSPYFQGGFLHDHYISYKTDGVRGMSGIGGDVLFYNLSEINFVPYQVAYTKIDSAFKRFSSRYERAIGYVGNIILDTSSRGDDSVCEDFIKNNPYEVLTIRSSRWLAKAHQGTYFQKDPPFFLVYTGDSDHAAFMMSGMEDLKDDMDRDRVLKVPTEVINDFKFDLITALQDIAGVSTASTGKYIPDGTILKECMTIKQLHDDVLMVDMYDLDDKIINYVQHSVRSIPSDKILYIRFDIGVVGDYCGISVSYFDEYVYLDEEKKVKVPSYATPLAFALSRKAGEETSITALHKFVTDLSEVFEIGIISYDQYASRQLGQDLKRDGFRVRYLSVDRTDNEYRYFKNCFSSKLWKGPVNKILYREIVNLLHEDNKIDHPNGTASDGHPHSKDISDALVGCIYSIYDDLEIAVQLSSKYRAEEQSKILDQRQDMMSNDLQNYMSTYFGG